MDDLEAQREKRRINDELLSTPNCVECLHRMEAELVDGRAVWLCPNCGTIREEG